MPLGLGSVLSAVTLRALLIWALWVIEKGVIFPEVGSCPQPR